MSLLGKVWPQTSSPGLTWERVRNADSGPTPDLQNDYLHFKGAPSDLGVLSMGSIELYKRASGDANLVGILVSGSCRFVLPSPRLYVSDL